MQPTILADPERKARTELGLALSLETACRDFELMLRVVGRNLVIFGPFGEDLSAGGAINMALAKSFVFNAARAVRILEEGAGMITAPKSDRKAFISGLESVSLVRNVNEHGYDPKEHPRRRNVRPTIHQHEIDSAALDETSLIILGMDKILMGPVNLCEAYPIVARLRDVAGYAHLPLGAGLPVNR